jgi:hypothetical protein
LQCSSIARVLGLFSSQTSSIARVYGSLMAKLIYRAFSGSGYSHCKAQCKGLRYRAFSSFQRALEFSDCKAHCKGFRVFSCQSSFTSVSMFWGFLNPKLTWTFNYKDKMCSLLTFVWFYMCRVRSKAVAIIGIRAAQTLSTLQKLLNLMKEWGS